MAKTPKTPSRCVFCGRSQDEVNLLITTENAAICSDCAEAAYNAVREVLHPAGSSIKSNGKVTGEFSLKKPREMYDFMSQYVIGQDAAKKVRWRYTTTTSASKTKATAS